MTILAVGEDADLLRKRAEVLRKTGANVLCSSGAVALKFIAEWEFDLVVLGHSVRQQDAERIKQVAHRQGSKTLVMLLVSDRMHEQEYDGIDLNGRLFGEPDRLMRSAADLLARQRSPRPDDLSRVKQMISPLARKKPASCPAEIATRKALIEQFESHRAG